LPRQASACTTCSNTRIARYFSALLWVTAVLATFRFSGCVFFLFKTGALRLTRRR